MMNVRLYFVSVHGPQTHTHTRHGGVYLEEMEKGHGGCVGPVLSWRGLGSLPQRASWLQRHHRAHVYYEVARRIEAFDGWVTALVRVPESPVFRGSR